MFMQGPSLPRFPQSMPCCGRCMRHSAPPVEPVAAAHPWSCGPHRAPAQPVGRKTNSPVFLPTNSPVHALRRLADRIKHAGHLPWAGEGGTTMRESNQRGLWLRSLRSHRSQSPSGTCAEWRTQQPSSGCEGDDHAADAHGRSAESPRWAWAGGGLGRGA